jgi:hypothetical protein
MRTWLSLKALLPSRHAPSLGVGALLRREPNIWLSLKKGPSPRAVVFALGEERYLHSALGAPSQRAVAFCKQIQNFATT